MNFVYNADTGKVIDKDVRLETMEDLEREIDQILDAEWEMEQLLKDTTDPGMKSAFMKQLNEYRKMKQVLIDLGKRRFSGQKGYYWD